MFAKSQTKSRACSEQTRPSMLKFASMSGQNLPLYSQAVACKFVTKLGPYAVYTMVWREYNSNGPMLHLTIESGFLHAWPKYTGLLITAAKMWQNASSRRYALYNAAYSWENTVMDPFLPRTAILLDRLPESALDFLLKILLVCRFLIMPGMLAPLLDFCGSLSPYLQLVRLPPYPSVYHSHIGYF